MIHKISMRISNETFRSLQEEAKKYRVKISVVARCRLMQPNEILPSRKKFDSAEDFSPGVMTTERGQAEIYPGPRSQSEFAVLETLYLLREFLPHAVVDICYPADAGANLPDGCGLQGYDGVVITGLFFCSYIVYFFSRIIIAEIVLHED